MRVREWATGRGIAAGLSAIAVAAALVVLAPLSLPAQQMPDVVGAYAGEIGAQQATLHLRRAADGTLSCTLDHLDLSAPWMFTCADLRLDGQALSFGIPSVNATWHGTVAADGTSLTGTWTQRGSSWLVVFVRQEFIPAAKPSPVDGIWLGVETVGSASTRIQIVVKSDRAGREYCTMDMLDVYYSDLECANVAFKGSDFSFDVPTGGEHWSGKLSADGMSLAGSVSARMLTQAGAQDLGIPLNFTRQSALSAAKPKPAVSYDPPLPPVSSEGLQAVLDRDLAEALRAGELAPSTGAGVSIAVFAHGVRRVFSYGTARPDSIFEIGSITKTFTGLLLSQMAVQGKVRLDEPVRELLPPGTAAKPPGAEITLLDLATRRSGLPPMPDNIDLTDIENPYASYRPADLLAYIGKLGVAKPPDAASPFGSLGFGLLGVALANRAGVSYGALLKQQVTDPLGLNDTAVALSPEQQARFIPGHDEFHGAAKAWDSDALAGAIALRSTAGDLLTFLQAHLHPEELNLAGVSSSAASLAAALRQSLQPQTEVAPGMRIALGWLYQAETGNYWHNGATAAYSSYAFFNPKGDYAAVVLLNGSPGVNGSFVEVLGRHISQRLAGKPAISLAP